MVHWTLNKKFKFKFKFKQARFENFHCVALRVFKKSTNYLYLFLNFTVTPLPNKRGSTASLSQVEESMYRHRGHSSASLGRLDPAYLRSAQSSPAGYSPVGFSPEEPEMSTAQSSPTKFGSLPTRGGKKSRKHSKQVCPFFFFLLRTQAQF
jgi:hypothetical protein